MGYFKFWESHKEMLTVLSKNNLIHHLFMPGMVAFAGFRGKDIEDIQLIFNYGGLWSVLTFWLTSHNSKLKPADIVDELLLETNVT